MTDKSKLPEGFFCYRENFMFGKCDGYKNKDNEYLFGPIAGVFLSGAELFAHLSECWRPAARREQDYFCTAMHDLKTLSPPAKW
jgi:hypothetical protein